MPAVNPGKTVSLIAIGSGSPATTVSSLDLDPSA